MSRQRPVHGWSRRSRRGFPAEPDTASTSAADLASALRRPEAADSVRCLPNYEGYVRFAWLAIKLARGRNRSRRATSRRQALPSPLCLCRWEADVRASAL